MWEKEEEKVICLIYLWCKEGILNASEHAAVVILSGKMKCLHSRLSEWVRKERGGEKMREGRAAILHKGVNHLIFTAPSHSPQNGYFVPSCSQRHGGGVGVGGLKTLLSHRTSVACSSTVAQPLLIHIHLCWVASVQHKKKQSFFPFFSSTT